MTVKDIIRLFSNTTDIRVVNVSDVWAEDKSNVEDLWNNFEGLGECPDKISSSIPKYGAVEDDHTLTIAI